MYNTELGEKYFWKKIQIFFSHNFSINFAQFLLIKLISKARSEFRNCGK